MSTAAAPADRLRLSEAAGRSALVAVVFGSAVVLLNATVVNVALPTLGRDLTADLADLQWVVNAYLVTLSALLLLGGTLGDRFGRRRIYVIGLVAFAVTSALCALAPSLGWLVAGRALQGAAGALVTPGSLAIIQASFAPSDRPAAIGRWSAFGGVGAAAGPVVGGWLVDVAGWPAVFWLVVPLSLVSAALALRVVPETVDPRARDHPLDLAGAAVITVALAAGSFALLRASDGMDATAWLAAGLAVVALLSLHPIEHAAAAPVVPPALLRRRTFVAANAVTLVVYAALGGVFFLLVVHLQTALGYRAVQAGAATLPVTVLLLLLSGRAGALAQRVGPRRPLTAGALVLAVGMLLLGTVGTGDGYVTGVLPGVVVFGLGLSLIVAPVTATALAGAPDEQAGVASAVNNAVSRTAQLLAVAILPLAAGLAGDAYDDPAAMAAGFPIAMRLTAALAVLGGAVAWLLLRDDALATSELDAPPVTCPLDGPPPLERTIGQPAPPTD
ncbi:MFS transporter [Nitriliruptor alkaliphilus]|uniref:MFS transporter n=1 Tax=Nitriliruptor alkaliphilus TaxID=427918 RepID=UPI0009FB5439|nr:MFS transporter [Nitriliruptor alkaliphilus]